MTPSDLAQILDIADRVHPLYPEAPEILAERQRLYPQGCFLLEPGHGYAFTHPWRLAHPPKLDTLLHRLPDHPDTYYIHDVAILPQARGAGHAARLLPLLLARAAAERLPTLSLVAVSGSVPFWARHGFTLQTPILLAGYGPEARLMVRKLAS